MRHASPVPWPQKRQATPEEFVDWFLSNDRDGQLEIAEWSIRFAEESMNCIMRHGGER